MPSAPPVDTAAAPAGRRLGPFGLVRRRTLTDVRIDVWSDILCPFCHLGRRHLELALEQFEHGDEVGVVWHSFQLDRTAPAVDDTPADRAGRREVRRPARADGRPARADGGRRRRRRPGLPVGEAARRQLLRRPPPHPPRPRPRPRGRGHRAGHARLVHRGRRPSATPRPSCGSASRAGSRRMPCATSSPATTTASTCAPTSRSPRRSASPRCPRSCSTRSTASAAPSRSRCMLNAIRQVWDLQGTEPEPAAEGGGCGGGCCGGACGSGGEAAADERRRMPGSRLPPPADLAVRDGVRVRGHPAYLEEPTCPCCIPALGEFGGVPPRGVPGTILGGRAASREIG